MTTYRPRWRTDATGYVARMAGQWASDIAWDDLDDLTEVVRQMPNGSQIEIVTIAPDVCEDLFGEPTAEPVTLRGCGCLDSLPCRHNDRSRQSPASASTREDT